jgi:cell division transport system permease protein
LRFSLGGYLLSETGKSIWRNKGSSLLSCATTAVALFLLGTAFLISLNVNFLLDVVEQQMEVQVYLKNDTPQGAVDALIEWVEELPGVAEVTYVSKEQALEELKEMFQDKESVLDGLGEDNPLPASIRLNIDDAAEIPVAVEAIKENENVDDVLYQEEATRRLADLGRASQYLSLGAMIVVGLVAVMVIGNSVRLTIDARRHEVAIMKLVGATDGFIVGPFILEGIVFGVLGGVLGAAIVVGIYVWLQNIVNSVLPFIPILSLSYSTALDLLVILLTVGVLVGVTGSVTSLRRHLRV